MTPRGRELAAVDVDDLTPDGEGAGEQRASSSQILSDALSQGGEAVGISRSFDFTEAFQDAIAKIPSPPFPDWLATYTVMDVGAQIGGIAGFNHLYVRVRGG